MKYFRLILYSSLMFLPTSILAESISASESYNNRFREVPPRLKYKAEILIEWIDTYDDCPKEKVCVDGQLYNAGGKTAYNVHLLAELGGTKYIKPKTVIPVKVEETTMEAGDRQQFYAEINRKVPYTERGKEKIIEVGKYNFNIVPKWTKKKKMKIKKKRKKHRTLK